MPVREPAKELRFTRARQATGFWIATAMLATVALLIVIGGLFRAGNPGLPHPVWALLPAAAAWAMARLAYRCTRHAYLILTPLGIEIFPLFRPATGMNLVTWGEIHDAEVDADRRRLTLHFNAEQTAGIVLSLAPVRCDRRAWLAQAIRGRLQAQKPAQADAGSKE